MATNAESSSLSNVTIAIDFSLNTQFILLAEYDLHSGASLQLIDIKCRTEFKRTYTCEMNGLESDIYIDLTYIMLTIPTGPDTACSIRGHPLFHIYNEN